jgi:hypothetical protein
MRRITAAFAASLALAAMSSAPARAQSPLTTPAAPPPETPLPTIEEGQAAAKATAVELARLDQQVYDDEIRMSQLRDAAFAAGNARVRAIRPAMRFHGPIVR